MAIVESRDLFYQDGHSDKEYHIQLISMAEGGFQVDCQWGRRGNTLQTQTKISDAGFDEAKKIYDKVVGEKVGKGYQDLNGGGVVYSPVTVVVEPAPVSVVGKRKIRWKEEGEEVYIPQLLNPIDESEVERYLRDDAWGMQEKKDGKHIILSQSAGVVKAFNKKGKEVGYPGAWVASLTPNCVLDGEAIGDTFHVFDLLELSGEDYRGEGYGDRWGRLGAIVFGKSIKVVPLAVGYKAKKALYDSLKKAGKEGVVFKKLDAGYKPGKAHSDMFKAKFYAEASVRVCKGREGKHSVGMEVLAGTKWVPVGNCTIGPSIPLPPIGSVIEVRFLYYFPGGSLYQPSFKEIRDDTDESECVIGQLKCKSSEE